MLLVRPIRMKGDGSGPKFSEEGGAVVRVTLPLELQSAATSNPPTYQVVGQEIPVQEGLVPHVQLRFERLRIGAMGALSFRRLPEMWAANWV